MQSNCDDMAEEADRVPEKAPVFARCLFVESPDSISQAGRQAGKAGRQESKRAC